MAVFVQDDFDESSLTALESHTESGTGAVGGGWTNLRDSTRQMFCLASNAKQVRGEQTSTTSIYRNEATPGDADYDVEADLKLADLGGDNYPGVGGRLGTNLDGYYAIYEDGLNRWGLYKITGGASPVSSLLGSYSGDAPNTTTAKRVKLKMRGQNIDLEVDGVLRIDPGNDSAHSAAGKAGIRGNLDARIGNYTATDVTSGGETITLTAAGAPWTGFDFVANNDVNIAMTPAAATWTGQPFLASEASRMLPAQALWQGNLFVVNMAEILAMDPAAATWTGQPFLVNEALAMTPAAVLWQGQDLETLAAEVVVMDPAGNLWTGLPFSVTLISPESAIFVPIWPAIAQSIRIQPFPRPESSDARRTVH